MVNQDIVLLITEGEKLDIRILNQVKKSFLPNQNIKIFPICLNIYTLYQKMSRHDDFGTEFIDVFSIIKEIIKEQESSNNEEFFALKRNQISEVFLFFDYDGHDTLVERYPHCIEEMLELFDDETGNGKLYINYPMVESYKHPIDNRIEILDIFPEIHYKEFVASICDKKFENVNKLNKTDWLTLFLPHLKSTNDLFCKEFSLPKHYVDTQTMTQISIYQKQKEQYVNPDRKIMVLSSFSWFLLEYLGENLFLEWQSVNSEST